MSKASHDFTLAYYSGDRKTGSIAIIERKNGDTQITPLPTAPDTGLEKQLKPIFIGVNEKRETILLDPQNKQLSTQAAFPVDAFPAHIYSDAHSNRDWFMNDGDKATGNDELNCGDKGSSVSVVENTASSSAKFLKTICVGRGHHQANFSYPSEHAPNVPHQVYVSNLKDGTLSVVGNDPADTSSYLQVVATINLAEADKEDSGEASVPNNSFPHGLTYSPVSGKVYNLNNGYGTVAVIDPNTHEIEERFAFKGHSNLFLSPDGRYIIGRGADRKTDAQHVIAKLSVYDVINKEITDSVDLQDIYISKYFFNPEGSRLYLSTSSSGSEEQQANLKTDALLSFDLSQLPKLVLINEQRLGAPCGTLDFLQTNGKTSLIFSSNAANGEVTILDGETEKVVENLKVGDAVPHSRLWLID